MAIVMICFRVDFRHEDIKRLKLWYSGGDLLYITVVTSDIRHIGTVQLMSQTGYTESLPFRWYLFPVLLMALGLSCPWLLAMIPMWSPAVHLRYESWILLNRQNSKCMRCRMKLLRSGLHDVLYRLIGHLTFVGALWCWFMLQLSIVDTYYYVCMVCSLLCNICFNCLQHTLHYFYYTSAHT